MIMPLQSVSLSYTSDSLGSCRRWRLGARVGVRQALSSNFSCSRSTRALGRWAGTHEV